MHAEELAKLREANEGIEQQERQQLTQLLADKEGGLAELGIAVAAQEGTLRSQEQMLAEKEEELAKLHEANENLSKDSLAVARVVTAHEDTLGIQKQQLGLMVAEKEEVRMHAEELAKLREANESREQQDL